jgi:hypothetical protein
MRDLSLVMRYWRSGELKDGQPRLPPIEASFDTTWSAAQIESKFIINNIEVSAFFVCHHSRQKVKANEGIIEPFDGGEDEIRISGDLDFDFPLSELTVNRSVVEAPFNLVDIFIPTPT